VTGTLLFVEPFSVQAELAGGPCAGARARRLVECALSDRATREVIEDVALLVTELVINGVRHGGAGSGSSLRVLLEGGRPGLRVEVVNPDHAGSAPVRRSADFEGGGGMGLNIVERVASRWGVRRQPNTVVWFEMDC
jgi:anti-sigma regulatory factor (Ser/Thr protein kinase)